MSEPINPCCSDILPHIQIHFKNSPVGYLSFFCLQLYYQYNCWIQNKVKNPDLFSRRSSSCQIQYMHLVAVHCPFKYSTYMHLVAVHCPFKRLILFTILQRNLGIIVLPTPSSPPLPLLLLLLLPPLPPLPPPPSSEPIVLMHFGVK